MLSTGFGILSELSYKENVWQNWWQFVLDTIILHSQQQFWNVQALKL